nr:integrase, catalytic region, zinc finger, CCHC-type, peptidase aspartic, catalytic [Tanacetum cinerariifolium]
MTGDRSQLMNFVKKFIGTVRFGNDHFVAIMGYGDYVIGDSVISMHSCYVRDTDGVKLSKGSRGSNLYTISVEDIMKSSAIYLLSKASKNKSWLWNQRLNHLNFGTINDLARKDFVRVSRTPQLNDIVERWNHTLVEATRTILIFFKAPMFLWAEAIATACYTQNRSLIHTRHNKTSYELVHDKKPDLTFLRVFGALCYPTNNNEDLGKLQPTAEIGIFIGYAPSRMGYKIYNKRTRCIMETIHISLFLVPNPVPATPYVPPTNKELEILIQSTFDEYLEPPRVERSVSPTAVAPVPVILDGVAPRSTIIEDNPFAHADNDPFVNVFAPEPSYAASSFGDS